MSRHDLTKKDNDKDKDKYKYKDKDKDKDKLMILLASSFKGHIPPDGKEGKETRTCPMFENIL